MAPHPDRTGEVSSPAREMLEPGYQRLFRTGALRARADEARRHMEACDLCPNRCGVNRRAVKVGATCQTYERARVHAAFPHHGEEDVLRGRAGSGTIFFSSCNLRCVYCQNWEISWRGEGELVSDADLAEMMLGLQRQGCHNVNLVSPSHVVAQVLGALCIAAERGLEVPLVWNSGGFDSLEALRVLDGVVDVYMPDVKYSDSEVGRRCSHVQGYAEVSRAAVQEMHRQVGDLVLDARGLAVRGLIVRHLVLPSGLAGTEEVMRFLAEAVSPRTWVNLMDQYRPCYRAGDVEALARRPTSEELRAALQAARRHGLARLDPGGIA
ncbi:MAG TPA: radical SAM protein [Anaeromyxobacteraceae bacterium]|nr:radical SAM protein [Anaeromyxobacteraceae bacterium]